MATCPARTGSPSAVAIPHSVHLSPQYIGTIAHEAAIPTHLEGGFRRRAASVARLDLRLGVNRGASAERDVMPENATVLVQLFLCQECSRVWLDPRERWRVYLTDDDPAEPVPYCPDCAHREFDPN
jgi:hypothetical protein